MKDPLPIKLKKKKVKGKIIWVLIIGAFVLVLITKIFPNTQQALDQLNSYFLVK